MEKYYTHYTDRVDKRQAGTHKRVHDRYLYTVERLGKQFSGQILEQITRADIVEYIISRRNEGALDSTIRTNDIACLFAMFNYAEAIGIYDDAGIPNFRSIKKLLRSSKQRQRYLSAAEYDRLIENASTIKNIIVLAVETGMRKEEYLSLLWRHVDLQDGFITVMDTKNGTDRTISISQTARELLQGLQQRNKTINSDYVICMKNGKRYLDYKKGFAAACIRAKVNDLCIHDLRRTFGSWRLQGIKGKKLSMEQVSSVLGHKNIGITQKAYAFLDERNITL